MKYLVKKSIVYVAVILAAVIYSGCGSEKPEEIEGVENAVLTDAPNVPPPINRNHPSKVIVNLDVQELVSRLADGVEYTKWTFGGKVPGKFIRVREGDLVEFHLHNHPSSKMPHNIDLHAVTGPGGGAASSFTAPGHSSTFTFKALNPGLFIYHCAMPPVPLHVANGMYGLILVEPKDGLPKVDKEYYVLQSEFYTEGNFGDPGLQQFSMQKALDEKPSYVVFNGEVGSLLGDKALKAEQGQTVRLFLGNAGPNLTSSFHLIGEIFDEVYAEGGSLVTQKNVGTTLIPAGGTAITQFKVEVPGEYILVDHSLFRAFNKGALGQLKVSGPGNKEVYSGKQSDDIYLGTGSKPEQNLKQSSSGQVMTPGTPENAEGTPSGLNSIIEAGRQVFAQNCMSCHQATGQGLPNVFPPLAKSDYLMQDKQRSINIVMKGHSGPITVNGKNFNGTMPQLNLSDEQIAAVLTYVRNSWGNKGDQVTVEEVRKVRGK